MRVATRRRKGVDRRDEPGDDEGSGVPWIYRRCRHSVARSLNAQRVYEDGCLCKATSHRKGSGCLSSESDRAARRGV